MWRNRGGAHLRQYCHRWFQTESFLKEQPSAAWWRRLQLPTRTWENSISITLTLLLHAAETWASTFYLSPSRTAFICRPIRQANSGPVLAPGRNFSNSPPSQTSILSGCLYTLSIFLANLQFLTTSCKSLSVRMGFSPQNRLQTL